MKIAVKSLVKNLQEQLDQLTSIENEYVDVHYSSDDINGYGGDINQVQYFATDINVVEDGIIHIATSIETI